MLAVWQSKVIFIIFCLFILAFASLEVYLIISIIREDITAPRAVIALFNSGFLSACSWVFYQMVRNLYLIKPIPSITRLHKYASDRCLIMADDRDSDEFEMKRKLLNNILEFMENCLRDWLPGTHFELCVFVDKDQPLLFCYFDSSRARASRSMRLRQENHNFYVDQNYEVVGVLRNPTSQPHILGDTLGDAGYSFTSDQQKRQIRSTILLNVDLIIPCALVITSNEKNSFPESSVDLQEFVRFGANLIKSELLDGNFHSNIRLLRPYLFSNVQRRE